MEKSIIVLTIFIYLFFTVSTVTIALDDISLPTKHEQPKTTTQSVSVPVEIPESETTQVFDLKTIDPPRMIINRHFYENTRIPLRFVRKHPCKNKFKKMFMIHDDHQNNYKNNKRVVSYGNDMILSDLTTTHFDVEKFPTKRFEFNRKYGHRHHHHHEKEEEFSESKKERKGGFMRGIRKFLKHTFD
ncbi:hypothetical protein Tco_1571283 [Tanacetum coccineum]